MTKEMLDLVVKYQELDCLICGSSDLELVYQRPNYPLKSPPYLVSFDLRYKICRTCGLVFLSPRLHPECRKKLYENFMLGGVLKDVIPMEEIEKGLGELLINFFEDQVNETNTVLEIGCANGELLYYLNKKFGCEVMGLEPSSIYCRYGRGVLQIPMTRGGLETFSGGPYDVIMSFHVFEHLDDPVEAFRKTRALLSDEGYFLMAVPSVFNPTFSIRDMFSSHNFMFSSMTIRNIIRQTDFEIIDCMENNELLYILKKSATNTRDIMSDYPRIKRSLDISCQEYKTFVAGVSSRLSAYIDEWRQKNSKVAVWGAGEHTLTLFNDFDFSGCDVRYFIDSNHDLWGTTFYNISIQPPEELKTNKVNEVLISSNEYESEISRTIERIDPSLIIRRLYD
jgi:SAM-dependent methyltransferase